MLVYLVEELCAKEKNINQAKGICLRNNIFELLDAKTRLKLDAIEYDGTTDTITPDKFGPLTGHVECLRLPAEVKVEWISTLDDIVKLNQLLSEPYIGIDCEWRPSFSKFDQTPPSII